MAKEWRDAFGKQNEDVILLSETPDGRQSLEFPAISRLDVLPLSSPGLKNRLFLLNNAIWPQLPTIVGYDQPSMNCLQITKSKNNNIVDISISLRLSMNQYANSSADIRESRIVWRAIQPISSSSTSTEMVYLSTLPIGWIPDNAMDLFQQFIAQIKTDWLEVCSRFGKHLSAQRLEQLALKGKPSSIIDCLAQDAQRLTVLRSDLAGQVYKAEEFMTKYCARYNADQIPKSLITLIKDDLETGISKEIENLALTLNDILQTEFALVSIYEARLSTKLAQNVMLLTYVSIFYLPLGFCAALWAIPDMTDMSTRMPFILTATVVSLVTLLVTFSLDRIAAIMLRVYQLLKDYIAKKCGRIAAKWKEWKKK
ncbi:hypothetical protein A0O28_0106970 [Trichoderma guizhouense]|uniref:Uncharacterized protein n=1 Tax=Trichoderma guizhouense TaxID=1491466 RepID=A0A1T3CIS6_9HYPO|nr:hypothetical protein A0O28_0106970 [Trichoderma guizhouense]